MQEQYYFIGEVAGKIFRDLQNSGPQSTATLQKKLKVTDTALFNQAIGWLCREDKVNIEKSGRTTRISLSAASVE